MGKFVPVFEFDSMTDGEIRRVELEDKEIVVIRTGDEIYALEDRCTHEDYPLSDGYLQDGEICCMMHGASFDLRTGEVLTPPAYTEVMTFKVRVNAGMIEIEIE